MLKQHGLSVESLPHDVVELILERLPVDSLLRLKSVSKNWKSTISIPDVSNKDNLSVLGNHEVLMFFAFPTVTVVMRTHML